MHVQDSEKDRDFFHVYLADTSMLYSNSEIIKVLICQNNKFISIVLGQSQRYFSVPDNAFVRAVSL